MKKLLSLLVVLLCVFISKTFAVQSITFNGDSIYYATMQDSEIIISINFDNPGDTVFSLFGLDLNGNMVLDPADKFFDNEADTIIDGDDDDEDTTVNGMYQETFDLNEVRGFLALFSGDPNKYTLLEMVFDINGAVIGVFIDTFAASVQTDTVLYGSIADENGNKVTGDFAVVVMDDNGDSCVPVYDTLGKQVGCQDQGDDGPPITANTATGEYAINAPPGDVGLVYGPSDAMREALFDFGIDTNMTSSDSMRIDSLRSLLMYTITTVDSDSAGAPVPQMLDLTYFPKSYELNLTIVDAAGDTLVGEPLDVRLWPADTTKPVTLPFSVIEDNPFGKIVMTNTGEATLDIYLGTWVVMVSGGKYFGADTIIVSVGDSAVIDLELVAEFYVFAGMYSDVTIKFDGMTPHLGQKFGIRAINTDNDEIVDDYIIDSIASDSFQVDFSLMNGKTYNLDFYADFNNNGKYDAPPVDHAWRKMLDTLWRDTTIQWSHNTNFTDIEWNGASLTLNFTGMTPHVGQLLQLEVVDKKFDWQVDRITLDSVPGDSFSITAMNLQKGHNYKVNFYADFNGNGYYNAPPADHAWQLSVDSVRGDTSMDFSHNTTFTDIMWEHTVTINGTGFDPHIGQLFAIRLIDAATGWVVDQDRDDALQKPSGQVDLSGLVGGRKYHIDFFADFNNNGYYDAPPVDHAWRIVIDSAMGDTIINFAHDTNFTDIMWQYWLGISFMGMNPHLGQKFELRVIDVMTEKVVADTTIDSLPMANFNLWMPGLQGGRTYDVDFYADFNGNGYYDAPPIDHAWSLTTGRVLHDIGLQFMHNLNFTDIGWDYNLTLSLSGMNPHLGQMLKFRVIDKMTNAIVDWEVIDSLIDTTVDVNFAGIMIGHDYRVDFYADFNSNGKYDAPSVDHAWRLDLDSVMGDTTLMFQHNTNFTDIKWDGLTLTFNLKNFDPHLGQLFELWVIDKSTGKTVSHVKVDSVDTANFSVMAVGLKKGKLYDIDFYADFNGNDLYDAPPVDHAWRLVLDSVMGDTSLDFMHDTNFTDIFPMVPLAPRVMEVNNDYSFNHSLSPNPTTQAARISFTLPAPHAVRITIYDLSGMVVDRFTTGQLLAGTHAVIWNARHVGSGMYFYRIEAGKYGGSRVFILR